MSLPGCLLGGVGHGAKPAAAAAAPADTGTVSVDGVGQVSGVPNVLSVTMGVSVVRNDVTATLNAANNAENAVRKALGRDGVRVADLQTANVSIYPAYNSSGLRDGYNVNETLTAKVGQLSRAGRVISDAVTAGGSSVVLQGISFDLENDTALLSEARDAAYSDANAKADDYATLSGRSLGKVLSISETVNQPSQPLAYGLAAKDAASSAPIDAGTQQVSVSISVRWALT